MIFTKHRAQLFFTIIFFFCLCSVSSGQKLKKLTGKVVLTRQEINIFLIPECNNCNLDALEAFVPDEDGKFSIDIRSGNKYYLFLEEKSPDAYWAAVNFPQGTIRYLPEFRGVPVFNTRKFSVNVGIVEPTIKYVKSEIDLSNIIGKTALSNIKIQTRDRNGKIVSDKSKVEERFWTNESKLKIYYPQGKWILDIFINRKNQDKKIGAISL